MDYKNNTEGCPLCYFTERTLVTYSMKEDEVVMAATWRGKLFQSLAVRRKNDDEQVTVRALG